MVIVTYNIDPKYAGVVIGKGGSGIRELKSLPGVQNIYLDTKTSSGVYILKVTAVNRASCDGVYREVQRKIQERCLHCPEVNRTLIDVDDRSLDVVALRAYRSRATEAVIANDRNGYQVKKFIISGFSRGSLVDTFDINLRSSSAAQPIFMEFMEKNITEAFQEALENHKCTAGEVLDLHVSPGKVLFGGSNGTRLLRSKLTGTSGTEYLKEKGLKTYFTPNLNPDYLELLSTKLLELGFENLNAECPEAYTTVHLDVRVGADITSFSALLALDKNLEAFKVLSDDPRLSEEKKTKMEQIISAKTIGDVLGLSTSATKAKIAYFKLSRDLHPDKNLHPGATEAFKKLKDAYEKASEGKPLSTSALSVVVEQKDETESETELPPKVVKVKTKVTRMCVITTLSDKKLDMRASLKRYEDDKFNLTGLVRETLNACWDQRDATGRIRAAQGNSDISVSCVKQVLELHTWAKEVPYMCSDGDQTAIVEVKIKKLREKAGADVNWHDCVEVDFKLNTGGRAEMTGQQLANEIIELRKWIRKMLL